MNTSHAHQILSVDNNASFDEVKYSYRKLVLQYHPDKNKNSKNDVKFKKATEAYHYLKNQNKHSNSTSSFSKKSENNKRKTKKLNFTGKRIGVQVVKIKRLKRIGVNSLKNLKRIKTGGSSMKRNSGKTMTLLQIRVHRRKNPNNSKQKQVRLILECKLTKACA